MLKTLKNIYWELGNYYADNIAVNKVNSTTGISGKDKKKLETHSGKEADFIKIFGQNFYFTNGQALIHSIEEIFYGKPYLFKAKRNNPLILDCGANMGLSTLYFKTQYPDARIIAFEPDPKIFELLKKNVENLKNNKDIEIHQKGIWHEDTVLQFFSQGALSGSFVTDFAQDNNVVNIETVDLNKYLDQKIDLLKIDIEGAENILFFHIADHLENVDALFLEYHSLKGEEQKLGEILTAVKKAGFRYYIKMASDPIRFPFMEEEPKNSFDVQLNIFCYRP